MSNKINDVNLKFVNRKEPVKMNIVESQTKSVEDNSEIKKSVLWIYYVIFFAVLNESVFNVSTPSIAKQFGLDASGVSWVVTIFFIVFGMGMVIFGKLSDMYSIKKLITIGISLYAFGSILGFDANRGIRLSFYLGPFKGLVGQLSQP